MAVPVLSVSRIRSPVINPPTEPPVFNTAFEVIKVSTETDRFISEDKSLDSPASATTALETSTEIDWDRTESTEERVDTEVEIDDDNFSSTLTVTTLISEIDWDRTTSTDERVETEVEMDEDRTSSTLTALDVSTEID